MPKTDPRFTDPLDQLLDPPIAFHRAFKTITGSTVAALMLGQSWYWTKRHPDTDGWYFQSQTEWLEQTGLTRTEQETARKILKRLGLQEEVRKGVPARLYFRVNRDAIYTRLGFQIAGMPQSSPQETPVQEGSIPADIKENAMTSSETPSSAPIVTPEQNARIARLLGAPKDHPWFFEECAEWPEHLWPYVKLFKEQWHFALPEKPRSKHRSEKGRYSFFLIGFEEVRSSCAELGPDVMIAYRRDFEDHMATHNGLAPHTVSSPKSLVNVLAGKAAEMRGLKAAGHSTDNSQTRPAPTKIPNSLAGTVTTPAEIRSKIAQRTK